MATVRSITDYIAKLAPIQLAFDWDNVGLLMGDYSRTVSSILLTLDVNEGVIDEAIENKCELIIAHHPFIFEDLKKININEPLGKLIEKGIKHDLNIYVAHTNLDLAYPGLNHYLAELLAIEETKPLQVIDSNMYYKLVVFVPVEHQEKVREAILAEGAGFIGNYSHTSFASTGIGTFKPLTGSTPFTGEKGELSEVKEVRLETIVAESVINDIVVAIKKVHPYEEVAYDLYPLNKKSVEYSLGLIGKLPEKVSLSRYLQLVRNRLKLHAVKYLGNDNQIIDTIAICSGSGAELINIASKAGADLFITGDVKYHQAQLAEGLGLALLEAGHYQTEIIVKDYLFSYLSNKLKKIKIKKSEINTNPWVVMD